MMENIGGNPVDVIAGIVTTKKKCDWSGSFCSFKMSFTSLFRSSYYVFGSSELIPLSERDNFVVVKQVIGDTSCYMGGARVSKL